MSNVNDYNQKLEAIKAIRENDVKLPYMPVSIFIQEGEDLYTWCQPDKDVLMAKGLNWSWVEELPACLGALREAQSRWNAERNTQEEAAQKWKEKAPLAYDLRDTLIHDFRYAYREREDIIARVSKIAEGRTHADMIQDLNDLAVLGREYPDELTEINMAASTLDMAAESANELGELLAIVNGDREEHSEIKTIRDKAHTLCKSIIDEIRSCGQYAFWRNPDRVKGYASDYIRKYNKSQQKKAVEQSSTI
jgi:uncharacterized coiled-coil DUF342 family protein